ncbi:hypothetical protein [Robertkochia flava]|uniref:hypothetical protein n=1 Tax=Robertkochia flava TaxID=3447986 RepID=UPI001CCE4214|nr:hypothetical protein [Robertkochia marina]
MSKLNFGKGIVILFLALSACSGIWAQGCVAIRHFSTCAGNNLESNLLMPGDLQIGTNYRYFKSFRHFRGTEEEPDRIANGSEVINHSHSWDMFLSYGISNRMYASLTIPLVINTRSSLYEHGREERNMTFSRGVADIRAGAGYWLLDPEKHQHSNIAIGAGIKLPTGNFNATDIFYNVGPDVGSQTRPVDQSIQPGDGGFGFTIDLQYYARITEKLYTYGGGFYLFNPRETNGIRTFRETLSPILENESIMSVPDQFAVRAGLSYTLNGFLSGSLGMRYEGVPVEDVLGGSEGFRRPGNVLSLDPGIYYMKNNFTFNLNVPVAVRRERPQSVTDRETEMITGNPRNGDAAFADYLINVGFAFRIPSRTVVDPDLMESFN